jgi:hypothetical protein
VAALAHVSEPRSGGQLFFIDEFVSEIKYSISPAVISLSGAHTKRRKTKRRQLQKVEFFFY